MNVGRSSHLTWFKFCFVADPEWEAQIRELAQVSHGQEPWKNQSNLLEEYIIHTFEACHQQQKLHCFESKEGITLTVFNTGLVTHAWEEIFGVFTPWSSQPPEWKLHGFFREGMVREWGFTERLDPAVFFDDPSALVLDLRGEVKPNFESLLADSHISNDLDAIMGSAIDQGQKLAKLQDAYNRAKYMCRVNYRTPVPQYGFDYNPATHHLEGHLGFLFPLYITDQACPDVVLMVTRGRETGGLPCYVGTSLYSAEVAYRNARLLGKVESEWLRTAIAWIQSRARMARATTRVPKGSQKLMPVTVTSNSSAHLRPVFPENSTPPYPIQIPFPHINFPNAHSYKHVYAPRHVDVHKSPEMEMPHYEANNPCFTAAKCHVDNDTALSSEVNPCIERCDGVACYIWRELTPTPPVPSPSNSPSPHCEEKPGLACSCPRADHYYSIVRLTDLQRSYIRYIVVSSPHNQGDLYTVGIRYVCETKGAQQLLKALEANMAAEYKKGAQRRLCISVLEGTFCPMSCNCADIHVTPEGWRTKRPWTKDRNRFHAQLQAANAGAPKQSCAV